MRQNKPSLPIKVNHPFPHKLAKNRKEEVEKDVLHIFKKVEINIPLLVVIKQVPRYAKFLKELCTNKKKLKGNEKVTIGENISAVLKKKLPPKEKDPGMFAIPCTIINTDVTKCMLDLAASINEMPLSIYSSLNIGPLKYAGVIIQLADRSLAYPKGVIEDVLVKVNELIFPTDFYVINMGDEHDKSSNFSPILLGRPFLKIVRTKIDVHDGTLSMEFDGEKICFNIYDFMKHSNDDNYSLCMLDTIDKLVEDSIKYFLRFEMFFPFLILV